jgi:hypothetical protein
MSSITTDPPADDKESSFDWEKYETIAHAIDLSLEAWSMTLPSDKFRGLTRLIYSRFSDQPTVSIDDVQAFLDPMIDDRFAAEDTPWEQDRQMSIRGFRLLARVLVVAALGAILGSALSATSVGPSVTKVSLGVLFVGLLIDLVVIPILKKQRRETVVRRKSSA